MRKKKNKSGTFSIQVITKFNGKSKLVKTIGSSKDESEIELLVSQAQSFIDTYGGQQIIDFTTPDTLVKSVFQNITSHTEVGTELLLGQIFDEIGFNKIREGLLRELVFARLSYPVSKLKTSDYLIRSKNIDIPVQKIYRYLDKLYAEQKEQIQQLSYKHTLKILGGSISIISCFQHS